MLQIVPGVLLAAALLLPAAPARARETGKIRAAGTLNVEGRCRILTDDQGRQYALIGDLGSFTTGDRILVTGTLGAPSPCLEGATLQVESARQDVPRRAGLSGRPGLPRQAGQPGLPGPLKPALAQNYAFGFAAPPSLQPPSRMERVRRGKGSISVRGTLTGEGVECQALRGSDGQLYTLAGNLKGYNVGDKVHVVGSLAEVSTCQQGRTIAVEQIRLDDSHGDEPAARMGREVLALTGSLTGEGIECQAFRSEKGELYTLTGDLKGFKTGDRVDLVASPIEGGPCQEQGKTVQVKTIRRAK
jgi:hypothetical protein